MPFHLHISVSFLQPTCHARMGKEEAAPNEWPPSPLRCFQAMVAGAAARWAGDDNSTRASLVAGAPVEALKWLETLCQRSPPVIVAPRVAIGQPVARYVPNNSADLVAAKWAKGDALAVFADRTRKVFRPTHLLDGSTVHYVWRLTDEQSREARRYVGTIGAVARSVVALGWGIDAAIGDARMIDDAEAQMLSGERWEPGRVGGPGLRLPVVGSLDALINRYSLFLTRLGDGAFHPVPPLQAFRTVPYRRASDLSPRPFAAFVLRPLDKDSDFAAFAPTRAVCVAAMLRHAACEAARNDLDERLDDAWRTQHWAEQFVAGHGPRNPDGRYVAESWERFSYLALPSVGHSHADGWVRRVIIAEPFGGDGRSARWASQRLSGAILLDKHRGAAARLERVEPNEPEFAAVFPWYAARSDSEGSRTWDSVTPIILPGYDDGKSAKRERMLLDCLRHAGIDLAAVDSIESRRVAWRPQGRGALAQPLRAFMRPSYLAHLPALHARLTFTSPVGGPVAIGAGRHAGLGVFAVQSRQ